MVKFASRRVFFLSEIATTNKFEAIYFKSLTNRKKTKKHRYTLSINSIAEIQIGAATIVQMVPFFLSGKTMRKSIKWHHLHHLVKLLFHKFILNSLGTWNIPRVLRAYFPLIDFYYWRKTQQFLAFLVMTMTAFFMALNCRHKNFIINKILIPSQRNDDEATHTRGRKQCFFSSCHCLRSINNVHNNKTYFFLIIQRNLLSNEQ